MLSQLSTLLNDKFRETDATATVYFILIAGIHNSYSGVDPVRLLREIQVHSF